MWENWLLKTYAISFAYLNWQFPDCSIYSKIIVWRTFSHNNHHHYLHGVKHSNNRKGPRTLLRIGWNFQVLTIEPIVSAGKLGFGLNTFCNFRNSWWFKLKSLSNLPYNWYKNARRTILDKTVDFFLRNLELFCPNSRIGWRSFWLQFPGSLINDLSSIGWGRRITNFVSFKKWSVQIKVFPNII